MMNKILLFLLLLPASLFAQKGRGRLFLSNDFKIKNLISQPNYISEPVRLSLINYLQSQNLNPKNYFVDSLTSQNLDTLIVSVWDDTGLETLRKWQVVNDSLVKKYSSKKYPKPIGNPGHCFTAYYSLSKKEILAIDIWQ